MITEKEIIQKYLGVPFLHKGRTLEGLDCYGLILSIYKDMGIDLFDPDSYPINWARKSDDNYFIENAHKQWIPIIQSRFLDVVLFKNEKDKVNHAGIILTRNRFIHSSINAGTVINRLHDRQWMNRIYGYYRFKND